MVLAFILCYSVVYFAFFVSSTQAIECQGTARYTLTFTAEWRSQTHPDFPSGRDHFSSLVGCSHKADYVMWKPGIKATQGVKNVAEFGGTSVLNSEMKNAITSKAAYRRYQGSGIAGGTGTSLIFNIEVSATYPLVSFITMIAPSPDWFVGVHDYNLCNTTTGKWEDSRTRDLPPYDAGTDSGTRFTSGNIKTNQQEDIHILTNNTEGSFRGSEPVRRFGTFTFVKTNESKPVIKPSSTMRQSQTPSVNAKSSVMIDNPIRSTPSLTMQQSPTSKVDARSSDIMVDPPKTSMQSSIMQQTPTLNVNAKSSDIMVNPTKSSMPSSTTHQSPTHKMNAKSSDIMVNPTKSSMPSSTTHQSPTHKMNAKSSDIMVNPTKSSMPSSIMHQSPTTVQVQPSVVLSSKTSKHTVDPKERSTQQPEIKSSLNSNVATQTLNQTAAVTATASAGTTPTFTTTSAACSLKHFGFIHAAFLVILANVFLCL